MVYICTIVSSTHVINEFGCILIILTLQNSNVYSGQKYNIIIQ